MRCTLAVIAAIVGVATANPAVVPINQISDGQIQVVGSASVAVLTLPASSTAAAVVPSTSVAAVYSTQYITQSIVVTSCGSSVTNCPVQTSTTVYPVSSVVAPVSTSIAPVSTSTSSVTLTVTISSVVNATIQASSSLVPPPPISSNNAAAAVSSPAPIVSVITISTCIPTTYLSTVTIAPAPSSSAAAIPVSSKPVPPSAGMGVVTGSGVSAPVPTGSPIAPFIGSASSFGTSMTVVVFAAVVAIFLA